MSAWRLVNASLSPAGARAALTIMIFHRVPPAPDPLLPAEPDAARFEHQMRAVRGWFNVIALDDAVRRLADGTLPARALAITFDDGYANNHDVALPILRRLGLTATFFIATRYLDGGVMWNDHVIEAVRACRGDALDLAVLGLGRVPLGSADDRRAAIDRIVAALKYRPPREREEAAGRIAALAGAPPVDDLMMSRAKVRALAEAGMQIGAHTHSHPILATLDDAQALAEIARSKAALEEVVARPVTLFAYPNGKPGRDYGRAHVEQARALGFAAACSTAPGVATRDADPYQLPRFTPWDRELWKYGTRLSRNLLNRRYATA